MQPTTRLKFRCVSVTHAEGDAFTVELAPVTSGSPENVSFYKWTPSGTIKFSTINASAAAQFKVGEAYYIDLSPAAA